MHRSFKEWIRETASTAGLTDEQLIKAAGILLLRLIHDEKGLAEERLLKIAGAFLSGAPSSEMSPFIRAKEAVWHALKAEKVATPEEIQSTLSMSDTEFEDAVRSLQAEGKISVVDTYAYGKLIAVADDGSLNISNLEEKDKAKVASAAYANKSLNLNYRKVLELCRRTAVESDVDKVLKLLNAGPKRYTELVRNGVPKGRIYTILRSLIKEGKVRKVKRGKYAVA
jgi:hypothetical protein